MSSVIEEIPESTGEETRAAASRLISRPETRAYFRRKETFLRPVGAILLVCSLPLLLALMLLVKLTSRGPAIYRQHRVGKDGRVFLLYKLRTMYHEAEKFTGPVWSRPSDSRITIIGRLLRLMHLDELPQLWNVVRGEMDLVGPRPERPEIVAKLVKEIPGYLDRVKVLPGVTGLAQVNLPPDQSTDCVRRKLQLDREYIESASLWLDIRMIVCTALRMLGIRHGHAVHWMGLERKVSVLNGTVPSPAASKTGPFAPPSYRSKPLIHAGEINGSGRVHDVNGHSLESLQEASRPESVVLARALVQPDTTDMVNSPRRRPR